MFDTNYKVNPPLRSQEHIVACQTGLADGTIDVISTGHAPRAGEKKMLELDLAPFGMIGLETALSLVIEYLIEPGTLDWAGALAKLSINPANVLGIPKGTLAAGADADVIVIDPAAKWTLTREGLRSRSANTPFIGKSMTGRVDAVFVKGERKR
jgi:dihydroorotase